MAMDSDFLDFDNYAPKERFWDLPGLDSVASKQNALPQDSLELALPSTSADLLYLYEFLLMESQLNTQPSHLDESSGICPVCSTSPPLPSPSSQVLTFRPPKSHKIPQRPYKQKQWDYTPVKSIPFYVNGFPGVNMGAALRKIFTALEGRDDLVLQDVGTAFSCRFLFPGYPPNKSPQISTKFWNKGRDPITRSKLAYHIARKLKQYSDSMSSSHIMDASTHEQWRIGEGFMHLDNMFLAKLESVSKGSYQPEIWVVDPTM